MVSTEAGATILAGVTPIIGVTPPAGANNSPPNSGQAYSSTLLTSTNPDTGEYGTTITSSSSISSSSVPAAVKYYKMQGMDKNINGLYDTWIVTSSPDFSGTSYAGALATPLRDIHIAASW